MPNTAPISEDDLDLPRGRSFQTPVAGQRLVGTLEPAVVLKEIVTRTADLLAADRCGLFRIEPEGDHLRLRCIKAVGLSKRFVGDRSVAPGEGIVGKALAERRPVATANILEDPTIRMSAGLRALVEAEALEAVLAVPILLPDKAFGVLTVYRQANHRFTPEEVELVTSLAGFAGIALENARLYTEAEARLETIQRQHAAAQALLEVSQALTQTLDLELLFDLIAVKVLEVTGADACGISRITPAGDLEYVRAQGFSGPSLLHMTLLRGEGLMGLCLDAGAAVWSRDLQHDPAVSFRPERRARVQMRGGLAVPIVTSDGPYGVLFIGRYHPHDHTPQEIAFAEGLAVQAAIAIQNARLFEERGAAAARAERQRAQAEALAAVGRAISASLDLDEVLALVAERAAAATMADASAVLQRERVTGDLRFRRAYNLATQALENHVLQGGRGIAGAALQAGQPLWSRDLPADPRFRGLGDVLALVAEENIRGVLSVPIRGGAEPYGVLSLYWRTLHDFTEEEIAFAARIADQAAVAIENARLYEETREALDELAAIHEAGRAITQSLNLQETLQHILGAAMRLTETDKGIIWLLDEERQELVGTVGKPEHVMLRVPLSVRSFAATCLREGRALISESPDDDPRCNPGMQARFQNKALIAVPLRSGSRMIGILDLGDLKRPRRFTTREIAILERLAQQAVVAIENARLYAETRRAYEDLQAAQDQLVQVEKLRALGEMAGGVAHDFNNLLAAILGRVQLLRMAATDSRLQQGLEVIERAALDGAETVRRLLGFARVRPEADYAPVDLAALVPQVVELTRPRWRDEAQGRAAPIEAVLAVESIPAVLGNAAELREVLVNLVFNAVDAMPQGGRLILGARRLAGPARVGEAAGSQEFVEVFVRDTGVGMSDAVRRRAFDPFFTTKGVKGSGLGLSVAYAIVTRHAGDLRVETQAGAGTTVTIRLPATAQAAAEPKGAAPRTVERTGRVVVVDDQAMVGEALAELLHLQGHQVHGFTDPRRALEHLAREGADLLVTDLGMPEMSGWDVVRQSRELLPNLLVVLVTGWGDQLDPAMISQHRVNAVLAKPCKGEDIRRIVAELLSVPASG